MLENAISFHLSVQLDKEAWKTWGEERYQLPLKHTEMCSFWELWNWYENRRHLYRPFQKLLNRAFGWPLIRFLMMMIFVTASVMGWIFFNENEQLIPLKSLHNYTLQSKQLSCNFTTKFWMCPIPKIPFLWKIIVYGNCVGNVFEQLQCYILSHPQPLNNLLSPSLKIWSDNFLIYHSNADQT